MCSIAVGWQCVARWIELAKFTLFPALSRLGRRSTNINFAARTIIVRQGKGNNDRIPRGQTRLISCDQSSQTLLIRSQTLLIRKPPSVIKQCTCGDPSGADPIDLPWIFTLMIRLTIWQQKIPGQCFAKTQARNCLESACQVDANHYWLSFIMAFRQYRFSTVLTFTTLAKVGKYRLNNKSSRSSLSPVNAFKETRFP